MVLPLVVNQTANISRIRTHFTFHLRFILFLFLNFFYKVTFLKIIFLLESSSYIMLRQVTKKAFRTSLRNNEIRLRHLSSNNYEQVSLEDQSLFPAENGVIQNSVYGNVICVPKCSLPQYIWYVANKSLKDLTRNL